MLHFLSLLSMVERRSAQQGRNPWYGCHCHYAGRSHLMRKLTRALLLPGGPVRGSITFSRTITAIDVAGEVDHHELPAPLIAPGVIDTHVHGGAGGDTMDGVDGVARLAAFHVTHGTTTLLPTTMTNP